MMTMNEIKAVVIDDEYFNRELIKLLVSRTNPEFSIVGEAENLRDGYSLIEEAQPDVVFLDIKMPDGSGFDLLRLFPVLNFKAIFVTGFDEYIVKAFEFNAFDYILKPIDTERFQDTVKRVRMKVLEERRTSSYQAANSARSDFSSKLLTMPVQSGDDFMLVETRLVMYVVSEGSATSVVTKDRRSYTSDRPISDYSFLLEFTDNFVMPGKDSLINLNYLVEVREDGKMHAVMDDGRLFDVNGIEAQERVLEHFRRQVS
jgi:two-component system LytT family response regulator